MLCETLVCEDEPIQCKDPKYFLEKDCIFTVIPFYCPVLCGKCQTTSTTSTTSTTITTSTTTTTKMKTSTTTSIILNKTKCNDQLICTNGGRINTVSCKCECNNLNQKY